MAFDIFRDRQRLARKWQKQYGMRQRFDPRFQNQVKHRDASVQVRADWKVIEEMDFPRLTKLSLPNMGAGEDMYGVLQTNFGFVTLNVGNLKCTPCEMIFAELRAEVCNITTRITIGSAAAVRRSSSVSIGYFIKLRLQMIRLLGR